MGAPHSRSAARRPPPSLQSGAFRSGVGEQASLLAATVDVETLSVVPAEHRYTRLDNHRWELAIEEFGFSVNFDVDETGVLIEAPGWFRRAAPDT